MLKLLLSFLLLSSNSAHAQERPYDEAVSLGHMCQVAEQLHHNGIRHYAYPFDWLISNFNGLFNFIAYKGQGFLELDNIRLGNLWANTNFVMVTDTIYGFELLHDFPSPIELSYESNKEKYQRRINRFFSLLNSKKKVLFVRLQLTKEEAVCLDYFFCTRYPHLSYRILALNSGHQEPWGLDRVTNLQLDQIPNSWSGDNERWREILRQFPVKRSVNLPPLDHP